MRSATPRERPADARTLFPFLFSLLALTLPDALADEAQVVGAVAHEGKMLPVYVEKTGESAVRKFFVTPDGDTLDARAYTAQKAAEKRQRYGKLGLRLHHALTAANTGDSLDVLVFVTEPKTALNQALVNKKEAFASSTINNLQASESALSAIRSRLGRDTLPELAKHTNLATRKIGLRLTPRQIRELNDIANISSIAAIDDTPLRATPCMNHAFGPASRGGVGLCSLNTFGRNRTVALIEPGSIDTTLVNQHMWDVPLAWSFGSAGDGGHPSDTHAVYVAAILRNSRGSTSSFTKGGAYELDSMLYSTAGTVLSTFIATLNWTSNNGARITNNSWVSARYYDSATCHVANRIDWLIDQQAHEEYILHVVGVGNQGIGADMYNECVNGSDPAWDSSNCQRCLHWGHNMIAVGSIDNCTGGNYVVSDFAAWKDGPTNDEVPHVVAIGDSIHWPWSSVPEWNPTEGTSFSTPIITALAADLCDIDGMLAWYPEVLKSVILASASLNPVDGEWDLTNDKKAGAGLPAAYAAGAAADSFHRNPGGVTFAGENGCLNWAFPSSAQSGDSLFFALIIDDPDSFSLNFYTSWMSHPDHVSQGDTITIDDIDMHLKRDNNVEFDGSTSWHNTTEAASMTHPAGQHAYYITLRLYARRSTSNHNIYGGLCWVRDE